MSGCDPSHDRRWTVFDDCVDVEPHACMKSAKGGDDSDVGCNSAVVASERVSCRGDVVVDVPVP